MASDSTLSEQREQLRQWLQANLVGQRVQHPAIAIPIALSWQGLKHCLSSTAKDPYKQFEALRRLPELLRSATYACYEADNHTPPRKGVGVHILYAWCELDAEKYQVWLRVKQTPDALYFYDLGVVR